MILLDPAYWQNRLYFCGVDDSCKAFNISNASWVRPRFARPTTMPIRWPAGNQRVSSAADQRILWAVERDSVNNVSICTPTMRQPGD